MRAIGIDPGIERTGFAVLEQAGSKFNLLDCGCILTDKSMPFSRRLIDIASDLKQILKKWKPGGAAVEEIFFSKNVKTAIKVSHARGVILEVLEEYGIPIFEFNPSHIKLSATGDAKASKQQVKKMVQYLLPINIKNDDTLDAIASAMCLLTTNQNLIKKANA